MPIRTLIVKFIDNNAIHSMQELHLCIFLAIFTFSTVSVHSSANLSTSLFLHLQFSQPKFSPASHYLSHSHSQLLGFQIYSSPHTHLSINSLYSHLHLYSFHLCLLLQTLASSLHLHLQVL